MVKIRGIGLLPIEVWSQSISPPPSNITVCNSSPSLSAPILPYREMIFPSLSGVFSSGFELDLPLPVLLPTSHLCMAGSSSCLQRALLALFMEHSFISFSSQGISIIFPGYFTYILILRKEHLIFYLLISSSPQYASLPDSPRSEKSV